MSCLYTVAVKIIRPPSRVLLHVLYLMSHLSWTSPIFVISSTIVSGIYTKKFRLIGRCVEVPLIIQFWRPVFHHVKIIRPLVLCALLRNYLTIKILSWDVIGTSKVSFIQWSLFIGTLFKYGRKTMFFWPLLRVILQQNHNEQIFSYNIWPMLLIYIPFERESKTASDHVFKEPFCIEKLRLAIVICTWAILKTA